MPPRRYADLSEFSNPFYRETIDTGRERLNRRHESMLRDRNGHKRPPTRSNVRFRSELDRDFAAMRRVWQMLRAGAARMVGEVGRQY